MKSAHKGSATLVWSIKTIALWFLLEKPIKTLWTFGSQRVSKVLNKESDLAAQARNHPPHPSPIPSAARPDKIALLTRALSPRSPRSGDAIDRLYRRFRSVACSWNFILLRRITRSSLYSVAPVLAPPPELSITSHPRPRSIRSMMDCFTPLHCCHATVEQGTWTIDSRHVIIRVLKLQLLGEEWVAYPTRSVAPNVMF